MVQYSLHVTRGVAESPTLVLARGTRLGPFTVGSEGAWRVVANNVLGVHACLFFDGNQLYVAGGSEESMPRVNGVPAGAEWIAVVAPARISLGGATIEFRESRALPGDLTAVDPHLYLTPVSAREPVTLTVHPSGAGPADTEADTNPWFMLNEVTTVGPCVIAPAVRTKESAAPMVLAGPPRTPGGSGRYRRPVMPIALRAREKRPRPSSATTTPRRQTAIVIGAGALFAIAASTVIALFVQRF